jgi:hypothetical protein
LIGINALYDTPALLYPFPGVLALTLFLTGLLLAAGVLRIMSTPER